MKAPVHHSPSTEMAPRMATRSSPRKAQPAPAPQPQPLMEPKIEVDSPEGMFCLLLGTYSRFNTGGEIEGKSSIYFYIGHVNDFL